MGVESKLVNCQVMHQRFSPKKHGFGASFFWFELDLDRIDQDFSQLPLMSHNKFNIFEFKDSDHMDFDQGDLRSNVEYFLRQNGELEKPKSIKLWTNLRCFGYIFNPVSFYLIQMNDDSKRVIMEVGNTFNELKPFYVPAEAFKDNTAEISTPKNFYVSPFIALDTILTFKLKLSETGLSIIVNSDAKEGEKILTAALQGTFQKLTTSNLLFSLCRHPFVTLKIISLIHWHALLLWLKGIPFISKKDNPELQQGNMVWKK